MNLVGKKIKLADLERVFLISNKAYSSHPLMVQIYYFLDIIRVYFWSTDSKQSLFKGIVVHVVIVKWILVINMYDKKKKEEQK